MFGLEVVQYAMVECISDQGYHHQGVIACRFDSNA